MAKKKGSEKKSYLQKSDIFAPKVDISSRKRPRDFRRKKKVFTPQDSGVPGVGKMEDPPPCPPDRPWAFRETFPPLVVYRGTPPGCQNPHISGVLLTPLFDPKKGPSGPCSAKQLFWTKSRKKQAFLVYYTTITVILAKSGKYAQIDLFCVSQIIFGKAVHRATSVPVLICETLNSASLKQPGSYG